MDSAVTMNDAAELALLGYSITVDRKQVKQDWKSWLWDKVSGKNHHLKVAQILAKHKDWTACERFYKKHFSKARVEYLSESKMAKLPQEVLQIDAAVYAHKIFPGDEANAQMLSRAMQQDPKLHYFLRHNFFHLKIGAVRKLAKDRQRIDANYQPPELKLTELDGKVKVEFKMAKGIRGKRESYLAWEKLAKRLKPLEEASPHDPPYTIYTWQDGEMYNAWLAHDGIAIKPSIPQWEAVMKTQMSQVEDLNARLLDLMRMGFVEADQVENKDGFEKPVCTLVADSPTDTPMAANVHGYWMLQIPSEDGKRLHRFVMGTERDHYGWKAQLGRLGMVDLRHYRHFSGSKQAAHFELEREHLGKLMNVLMKIRKEGAIYQQASHNCCTAQTLLAREVLGLEWDTSTPMGRFAKLPVRKGGVLERLFGKVINKFMVRKGAGQVEPAAQKRVKQLGLEDKDFRHIQTPTDVSDVSKSRVDSPYQAALNIDAINRYRAELKQKALDRWDGNLPAGMEEKIDKMVRFAIPPTVSRREDARQRHADLETRLDQLVSKEPS